MIIVLLFCSNDSNPASFDESFAKYSGYGSFVASYISMFLFLDFINLNIFILFLLTFSLCLLSQFGDLFFSFLKRKANLKDTGKLLPGHGGILDRVDGIIFAIPISFILFKTLF